MYTVHAHPRRLAIEREQNKFQNNMFCTFVFDFEKQYFGNQYENIYRNSDLLQNHENQLIKTYKYIIHACTHPQWSSIVFIYFLFM